MNRLEAALIREIDEEIGVSIEVLDECFQVTHDYPARSVQLHFFNCRVLSGEPKPMQVADLRWSPAGEVGSVQLQLSRSGSRNSFQF